MKTQQVMNNEKRMINMNIDTALWRKARIMAAEKDTTVTRVVEHCLREELNNCKHDKIK
jgi:hypothetical protein